MLSRWHGATLAGKAGYTVGCLAAALIMVTSGFAYFVKAQIGSIGGSDVLSGGPQTGAMNILVMGLESRTNYQGQVLSSQLLTAMHAGSVYGVENQGVGGQDTNTLILIHIFAGGQKAVGFSIPRNDYVNYPQTYDGQSSGMVDQEYGLAYQQSLNSTVNSSMNSKQRYLEANEAGQAATIATVEAMTGQKIDHFAEANLAGYFYLAQAFGGIEVCLKSWNGGENLHDKNSGFNVPKAGYYHLAADQALAFVRERDNLPNGDLDRTRRQQAVLDYVIWKLEHEGALSDLSQLQSLMGSAQQYLITDNGWNLLDFASDMRALTGKNLQFETLPISGFATIYPGGTAEDVNTVNVAAIQSEVKNAFNPPPATPAKASPSASPSASYPASDTVVDVYNAGQAAGAAGEVMTALTNQGYKQGQTGNATTQSESQVLYGSGAPTAANAAKIASLLGVKAQGSGTVSAGAVEVVLGSDTSLPSSLTGGSSSSSSGSPGSSPSTQPSAQASLPGGASGVQSVSSGNDTNTPLKVSSKAPYGIPCVD